ncbi:MAG: LPS export ABC transporter periplasmic protein LptC [Brevinematia bacterium]
MKRLFLIFFLLLLSCGVSFKSASLNDRDLPDQVLSEFKYISSDLKGRKEWELLASMAKSYNQKNEIILENLSIKFFHSDGKIKSFLSANKGYINIKTMDVYAEGNVKIYAENKAILEAGKVYWNNTQKKFYSESNQIVILYRGNSYVKGYNLIADTELKEVRMDNIYSEVQEK